MSLDKLLPFNAAPTKPGFVAVTGSALVAALLNSVALFVLTLGPALAIKLVF